MKNSYFLVKISDEELSILTKIGLLKDEMIDDDAIDQKEFIKKLALNFLEQTEKQRE